MDILKILLSFLRPAVDDPEEQPELDLAADDPPPENPDPPPPDYPPEPDPKAELEASRKEARELKEKNERYERDLAEARRPPVADKDLEAWAKTANDASKSELERWQASANIELRLGRAASQNALAQAHDVSDRTAFTSTCMEDPTAKRYQVRVEQELTAMRQRGQNASREQIYTYLLGQDMRQGKFKKKVAPKPNDANLQTGKLPGARSDVGGKNAMTEHEKRAKRLENQQI